MQIRCEKCATLYTLDDGLLPPQGAPVQCTRCGHVFTAHPAEPTSSRTQNFASQSQRTGTLVFNPADVEAALREKQQAPASAGSTQIMSAPAGFQGQPGAAYPGGTRPAFPGPTPTPAAGQPIPPAFAAAPTYPSLPQRPPTGPGLPAQPSPSRPDLLRQQGPAQQQHHGPVPHAPSQPQGYGAPPHAPSQQQSYGAPPHAPSQPQGYGAPPHAPSQPQGYGAPPHAPSQPQGYGAPPHPPSQPQPFGAAPHAPSQPFAHGPRPSSSPAGFPGPAAQRSPSGMMPAGRTPVRPSGARKGGATLTGAHDFERQMLARRKRNTILAVVVVSAAIVVAVLTVAGPQILGVRHDPKAVAKVSEALGLVVKGDAASGETAAKLADEALAIEPAYRGAKSAKGMGLYLKYAEMKDRIDRLEKQKPPLDRAFAKAKDATDQPQMDQLRSQMEQLASQHQALVVEATQVKSEAEGLVDAAYKGGEQDPDAIRGVAFVRAMEGDDVRVPKLAKAYEVEVPKGDGWGALIEGLLGASGRGSPDKRNAAIGSLQKALSEDGQMVLAHVAIGRSRLDLEDFSGARAALSEALKVTPDNAVARRLAADVQLAEQDAAERAKKKVEATTAKAEAPAAGK